MNRINYLPSSISVSVCSLSLSVSSIVVGVVIVVVSGVSGGGGGSSVGGTNRSSSLRARVGFVKNLCVFEAKQKKNF